jgi:L-cysteate sulfo-lyase
MSAQNSLQQRLDRFPCIPLAEYPTPLEYLPRLSAELSREIYIKRDDGIGPGLGGNKTRKLEYLLADAVRGRARKVVTFGGLQSNHARITAAAACKLGLEPHLFYFESKPKELRGNLPINLIIGAHMHFIPFGGGGGMTLEATNRLVRLVSWVVVGRHYFIPVGGHSWLGCLGYVRAALEIHQQATSMGIVDAHLITAAGTGGTLAGLLAGVSMIDSPLRPLGIDVGKLWRGFRTSLAQLSSEICHQLGVERSFQSDEIPLLEGEYSAPKYGTPSLKCLNAIRRIARLEGILLDPVYTGKAFAGLLDLIEKGRLSKDEPIIFLHTGGLPALFAFEERFLQND